MAKQIKYALLGFGGIAENRIAKEGFAMDRSRFAPLPGVLLVKACDQNPARRNAAENLNIEFCDSEDPILNDPEIDAVYIATNNKSHAALALKAFEAGKHVLLEKPAATTLEDAQNLNETAKKQGLSFLVDHMMVNNKLHKKAKDLLLKGELGTVNDSCFHMEFAYGYSPDEASTWRCSCIDELGGPIGDVASHCFYMAEYMFDSTINEIGAVYIPKSMPITVEDGAYIKFRMTNGQCGTIRATFADPRGGLGGTLSNLGFELYGDKAVIRGYGTMFQLSGYPDEPFPIRLELDRFAQQEKITLENEKTDNIYQKMILRHAQSIRDSAPFNAEDAVRNIKLCLATHDSAKNGGIFIKI